MHVSDKPRFNIRAIRESRGYTQEYMAEMLDICQSTYANLESGKSVMRVDRLLEICTILETDIHLVLEQGTGIKPGPHTFQKDGNPKAEMGADVRQMYDQLIAELRNEIAFLRSLIRPQHEHH
jgi:transcriptional regulator with XRE-family HTH domain